ncbi:MAG: urease accessory protein UreD [Burkholderiales bacterium]|nr:urease accessory protein UreD [Burkholderiales bacterium]
MDREPSAFLERKGGVIQPPQFQVPQPEWVIGKHALLGVEAVVRGGRTELWPTIRRIPYQWPGVLHYQDHDDQPFMLLHNSGGGFIEGDVAQFQMHALPGTRVLMTTTGANKFYKCETGGHCQDLVEVHLGSGCLLEYLPDEVIPYRNSSFSRSTRVCAPADARIFMTDVLTAGRLHHGDTGGETFVFTRMRSETALEIGGRLLWLDRLVAETPQAVADLEALWGGHPVMATVLAYAPDLPVDLPDRIHALIEQDDRVKAAVTCIDGKLLCMRLLADTAWSVHESIFAIWSVVRPSLAGKPARVISKP